MIFDILLGTYIDDLLIQATDEQTCRYHAEIVILILKDFGYEIYLKKSTLAPSWIVEHLGFNWNSASMTISLPQVKRDKISSWTKQVLAKGGCTAEELRLLLGTLESVRIATIIVALHYRGLQYLFPRPGRQGVFRPTA